MASNDQNQLDSAGTLASGVPAKHIALAALLVALVAVACYQNTFAFGFVNWDDTKLITGNPYTRGLTAENLAHIWTKPIKETYLPLRVTSYAIDYELFGTNASGYHVHNVILHAVVSLFVFWIAKRLTGSLFAALAAGLLFAAHPVHSEPVSWASGRKDVLSTALFLASYALYLASGGRTRRWPWLLGGCAVFVLSGLAKAMVVTLPALIILTDIVFGGIGRGRWKKLLPGWALYFAAAGVITAIAMYFASAAKAIVPFHFGGAGRTAMFMAWAALFYVKTMLFPDLLSARYPYGDTEAFGVSELLVSLSPAILILVAGAALGLFLLSRGGREKQMPPWVKLAGLGLAWFFVSLLPVMNLIPINVLVADRYLYVPSVGFLLAAAGVLWGIRGVAKSPAPRRTLAAAVLALLVAASCVRTYTRNEVWRTSLTLWESVVSEFPDSFEARLLLAAAYAEDDPPDYGRAFAELDEAEKLDISSASTHIVRGGIFSMMGDVESAAKEYDMARLLGVEEKVDLYDLCMQRAAAFEAAGDLKSALASLEEAVSIAPLRPEGHLNLGRMYERTGRDDKAEGAYLAAARLDPKFAHAFYNLGVLSSKEGDVEGAMVYYSKALSADPDFVEAMVNLASAHVERGNAREALELLSRAVALKPDSVAAHVKLGHAHAMLGNAEEARGALQAALDIDPGNVAVREMLEKFDEMTRGGS